MIFQLLRMFIISASCFLFAWPTLADQASQAVPDIQPTAPDSIAPLRQPAVSTQRLPVTTTAVNQSVGVSTAVEKAAKKIITGGRIDPTLVSNLENSADGLFILGWFHEFGAYGFDVDAELAYQYYQKAAERGQMDAAHYCWQRCLNLTPAWLSAMKVVAGSHDVDTVRANPQGLYLYAKWLLRQGGEALSLADKKLLDAAKLRQPQAINELYIQHFLQWSKAKRSFPEALRKLNRCADEGVVACYLLLGSLYQRHGYAQEALLNYLLLQQLDYGLFRNYLSASKLAELEKRLPKGSLPVVQSRVATRLATHPKTGFDAIDRFRVCSPNATYACIRKIVKRDPACMLSYFADSYFIGLRETSAYKNCMNKYTAD